MVSPNDRIHRIESLAFGAASMTSPLISPNGSQSIVNAACHGLEALCRHQPGGQLTGSNRARQSRSGGLGNTMS